MQSFTRTLSQTKLNVWCRHRCAASSRRGAVVVKCELEVHRKRDMLKNRIEDINVRIEECIQSTKLYADECMHLWEEADDLQKELNKVVEYIGEDPYELECADDPSKSECRTYDL